MADDSTTVIEQAPAAAAPLAMHPFDFQAAIDTPEFAAMPPEDRQQTVDTGLAAVSQHVAQNGGWDPEAWQAFQSIAQAAHAKAAPTLLEQAASAPMEYVGHPVAGMVKSIGAGLVGGSALAAKYNAGALAPVLNAIPAVHQIADTTQDSVLNGARDWYGAAQGTEGRLVGADHPLDQAAGQMFHAIDQGQLPFEPQAQQNWIAQQSQALEPHQAAFYSRAGNALNTQPRPEDLAAAKANSLASPRNRSLLHAYLATRNPKYKQAVLSSLKRTPDQTAALEGKEQILKSPGAQQFEKAFGQGSAEQLYNGADPVNAAALAAASFTGGASLAATGTRAVMTQLAKGAAEQAVFGAAQHMRDTPDFGLADTAEAAAKQAVIGTALSGLVHGAGKVLKRGKTEAGTGTPPPLPGAAAPVTAPTEVLQTQMDRLLGKGPKRQPILQGVPDRGPSPEAVPPVSTPATRSPILQGVPDRPPTATVAPAVPAPSPAEFSGPLLGDFVSYEGYHGVLGLEDGRPVVHTPQGIVEISEPERVQPVIDADTVQRLQEQMRPADAAITAGIADPVVRESVFTPASDGSLKVVDEAGRSYVPHNPRLLRSIREADGKTEVLLQRTDAPGKIVRLTGEQAAQAAAALLDAAANVEKAGDKVNLGTGIRNTRIKRNLQAGFLNASGFADLVTHAAEAIAHGVRDFATFAAAMIREFGDRVRQYLQSAWAQAMQPRQWQFGPHQGTLTARGEQGFISLPGIKRELKDMVDRFKDAPKFTDLKRTLNAWTGAMQASSVTIQQMMHTIEKAVPDPVRRAAITNWIQADGVDAVLAAGEAQSQGVLKAGYAAARTLTAAEKAMASKVRDLYDQAGQQAMADGVLTSWRDNYVNQVWKQPVSKSKANALAAFQGQLSKNFTFGKKRTFESFLEGEQAGFDPVTKDISKLLGLYLNELNKVRATRAMIADLTKGAGSDGRPLAAPMGGVVQTAGGTGEVTLVLPGAKGSVLFNGAKVKTWDYTTAAHPALSSWKFVASDTAGEPVMLQGQLALHPEAARYVNNALQGSELAKWMRESGDSFVGHYARQAVRAVDEVQRQIKANMMSLSGFHNIQEGTHAIGHHENPFTDIPDVDATNPEHLDMMNHGLMLAGDRMAMSQFMDGLSSAGSWMEKIPWIGPWQTAMSQWTFHHYIPGLKIKTYQGILTRNLARFEAEIKAGKATVDDVKYLTAKQTNAAYGHQNYRDMGRNQTFQHLLRLVLLAPDFLEGRAKFTGQAIQGIVSKSGREQLAAMATLTVTFYVAARIFNGLANKGDMKMDLEHLFSVQVGNRNYSMRSVPEDIFRLVRDWRSFTAGRVSPLIGTTALESILGLNRRGEKVTGTEAVQDSLSNAIPMSVRMVPGLNQLTATQKNTPVSPWEQFLGSLGLQIGRHSPITEAQKLAHAFAQAMGSDTRGSYPISPYQQLRYALEDLDWTKAQTEVARLLDKGGHTDKLAKGFHTSLFHPYTGSQKMDQQWRQTLTKEQQDLVHLADDRRQAVWERFLKINRR